MRARGGTIYARQSPLKKPTSETATPSSLPTNEKQKPLLSSEEFNKMFEEFGPMNNILYKDNFTGDFKKPEIRDDCSVASTASTSFKEGVEMSLSRASSTFSNNDFLDEPKGQKVFRGMIIGSENVDKQALVNAIYPSGENEVPVGQKPKQKFDLATRRIEKDCFVERYHFWLKEAEGESSQHLPLLNTYYKACSVFVLVHDTTDARSLNILENEIAQIRRANTSNKEVLFVLAINKQECVEEFMEFRKKHQIKILLEMDKIAQKREELKGLFESFAK